MDARSLYTRKVDDYVSFVSRFSHQEGIAALLQASGLLREGMRILDAGCGTGFSTIAAADALARCGFAAKKIDAFDLTPAMLARFEQAVRARGLHQVEFREADVRHLEALPSTWIEYDLILSVSMLEYVPRGELSTALRALRQRLAPGGRMVIFLTRKNPITWLLIEKGWHAQRYSRRELRAAFSVAGCKDVRFTHYPLRYFCLTLSNHVVIASGADARRSTVASGHPTAV